MESKLVLKPTIEKAPTEGMCGQRNTKHVAYVDKEDITIFLEVYKNEMTNKRHNKATTRWLSSTKW